MASGKQSGKNGVEKFVLFHSISVFCNHPCTGAVPTIFTFFIVKIFSMEIKDHFLQVFPRMLLNI